MHSTSSWLENKTRTLKVHSIVLTECVQRVMIKNSVTRITQYLLGFSAIFLRLNVFPSNSTDILKTVINSSLRITGICMTWGLWRTMRRDSHHRIVCGGGGVGVAAIRIFRNKRCTLTMYLRAYWNLSSVILSFVFIAEAQTSNIVTLSRRAVSKTNADVFICTYNWLFRVKITAV